MSKQTSINLMSELVRIREYRLKEINEQLKTLERGRKIVAEGLEDSKRKLEELLSDR